MTAATQQEEASKPVYRIVNGTSYLHGGSIHLNGGWVINVKQGGLEIIAPARGEVKIIRKTREEKTI